MKLFYDDEFEALRACIEGGKGYKATAQMLWPSMKPESAYARLKACTNGHGDQNLRLGEVIRVMTFNDCYDALYFACDETLHDRPQRRSRDDKREELVREFNKNVEQLTKISEQIKSLQEPKLKAA